MVQIATLVSGLHAQEWVIVTSEESARHEITQSFRVLPYQPPPDVPARRYPGAGHVLQLRNLLKAWRDSGRIARRLRGTPIQRVVATFPSDFSLILGWLLARRLDVPLALVLFDVYRGSRHGVYRVVARILEPLLFREAKRVVFLHEGLRRCYAQRYDAYERMELQAIENPLDVTWYRQASAQGAPEKADGAPCRVVFTGSVYHAQRDSVQRMCDAVNGMPPGSVRFEIYTHTRTQSLGLSGIETPNVQLDHRPRDEMPGIQAGADVLFLPLSFHSRFPVVVQTALPAKYPEYLASGVPILVHAPGWSWLAHLASDGKFAYVVDVDDVHRLRDAVRTLTSDRTLRATLASRAGEIVAHHDHLKISREFADLLERE